MAPPAAAPAGTHRLLVYRLAALAVVCLLVLVALASASVFRFAERGAPALTTAQLVRLIQPSVVAVSVTPFRSETREGSGFVFGAKGRILTSARLVTKGLSISVMDYKGVTYSAVAVGINRTTGVAELMVNGLASKPIKAAPGVPGVGTRVLVIDNPDGFLTHDVTQGAVSDTGSTLALGTTTYRNLLKTGAAATPGDTGGPLVNTSGQLVGMVTTDETGHAFAIPVATFTDDAKAWTLSPTPLYLGPPLVSATPQSLVIPSIGPGWAQTVNSKWDMYTWHMVWTKPPNYTYGGESVDIYLGVEPDESTANSYYQNDLTYLQTHGFVAVGPVANLGDEAVAYRISNSNEVTFAVLWRDRNAEGLVYYGGGIPPPPDVSMVNTLAIAFAQEAVIGADLDNYQ